MSTKLEVGNRVRLKWAGSRSDVAEVKALPGEGGTLHRIRWEDGAEVFATANDLELLPDTAAPAQQRARRFKVKILDVAAGKTLVILPHASLPPALQPQPGETRIFNMLDDQHAYIRLEVESI